MQSPASGAHASAKRSTLIKLRATLQMNVTGRFLWGFSCRPQTKPIIKICSRESMSQECKEPQVGSPQKSPFNLRLSQGASRLPERTLLSFPAFDLLALETGKGFLLQAGELWSQSPAKEDPRCWLRETEFLPLLP